MNKIKYKVGDRILIVENTTGGYAVGTRGVVVSTPDNQQTAHPAYNSKLYRIQKEEHYLADKKIKSTCMWHVFSDIMLGEKQPSLFEMEDVC